MPLKLIKKISSKKLKTEENYSKIQEYLFLNTILSSGLTYFWDMYGDSYSSNFLNAGCPSFAQLQLKRYNAKYFTNSLGRFTDVHTMSSIVFDESIEDTDRGIL